MLMSDIQKKDIVSAIDGTRLGRVVDLEVNKDGNINYMFVGENRLLRRSNAEVKVYFKDIRTIGSDVILVDFK